MENRLDEARKFLENPANRLIIDINSLKKKYKTIFNELDKLKEIDFFKTGKIVYKNIDFFKNRKEVTYNEIVEAAESNALFSDYLCSIYKWKKWKKIYNFNDELIFQLNNQSDTTDPTNLKIPMEFLKHIPFDTFFINANNFIDDIFKSNNYTFKVKKPFGNEEIMGYDDVNISGFFVRLESDNEGRDVLTFIAPVDILYNIDENSNLSNINSYEATLKYAMNYEIVLDAETIGECIQIAIDDRKYIDNIEKKDVYIKIVMRCLTYLLYILSANSDIINGSINSYRPKKKKESILDTVSEVQQFNVGYRIGSMLKQYRLSIKLESTEINGGKKIPHIRRGHWHHYWVGPRNSDNRELIVHWIPPITVNSNWDESPNANITPCAMK